MPVSQDTVHSLLAGVTPQSFGASVRFLLLESVRAPAGFEQSWSVVEEGHKIADQPWASDSEMSSTSTLIVIVGHPSETQKAVLQELATYLREHPLTAPPVLLVPTSAASADLPEMKNWLQLLVSQSVIDDVVWGMPRGYALAFAVQAKLQTLSAQLERLQVDLDARVLRADSKDRMLSSIEYARWQYLRARLFHALPPTRNDIEDAETQTVAGLRLGHKICRGAFGVVHAAKRADHTAGQHAPYAGMLVVDKHQGVRSFLDMTIIHSFINVMNTLSRTQHPNVSRMLSLCSSPKNLYVCMELCGPRTLFSRMCLRDAPAQGAASTPISTTTLKSMISQICDAVCHLHLAADVCHRDIKPENISFREHTNGQVDVKVFGFELSTMQPEGQRCKRPCGTMPFAAPDMILAGRDGHDGKAADMWSLGILLLEATRGLCSVERALPPLRSDDTPKQTSRLGVQRHVPPSADIARQVQDIFRKPEFITGLMDSSVPEAVDLRPWLEPIIRGLLEVEPTQRITAVELQPMAAA